MSEKVKKQLTRKKYSEFSKYLSYLLRHHPEDVGLSLMDFGWIDLNVLIAAINISKSNNYLVTEHDIETIVVEDKKTRYTIKKLENGNKLIRANQGHSIQGLIMDFKKLSKEELPEYLYHGTSTKNLDLIEKSGEIKSMSRQYVHLSKDIDTAINVGKRHGIPVVLKLSVSSMLEQGLEISLSDNEVYLTSNIPCNCIIRELYTVN